MGNRSNTSVQFPNGQQQDQHKGHRHHETNQSIKTTSYNAGMIPLNNFETCSASLPKKQRKIRCFACKSVLYQPNTTAKAFACPCGQVLLNQLDQKRDEILGPGDVKARCPRCMAINVILEGSIVVPCSCGLHLRRQSCKEDPRLVSTNDARLNESTDGPRGRWRRRQVTNEKIGWSRVWSEGEESNVSQMESSLMENLNESLNSMETKVIMLRLKRCLIDINTSMSFSKEELVTRTLGAVDEFVSLVSTTDLKSMLDDRLLDYSLLKTKRDLAVRLFCFEWSQGATAKSEIDKTIKEGLVRSFTPSFDLVLSPAFDFIVSTRAGLETLAEPPIVSSNEVIDVCQDFPFQEKVAWFQESIIAKVRLAWEDGHARIRVRRDHILEDSLKAFSLLSSKDMHRFIRFEFIGEAGQDAGGVSREWFSLVVRELLDPKLGLFSRQTNGCYGLEYQQPQSLLEDEKKKRSLYRFAGRVVGRALFEGQNMEFSFTQLVYKHILAYIVGEDDLLAIDEEIAHSTKLIREASTVAPMALNFTIQDLELKPKGRTIDVTDENKQEYLDLRMRYLLLDSFQESLRDFLFGVYETVPLCLLSVFDPAELDLLLSGLPEIDVEDWKRNTVYRGEFAGEAENHPVVAQFWEILSEANAEERARFLQFATGTTRVPVQGFSALQGNDGQIKLFTLESLPLQMSVFPRAHTCFNRIDLPLYRSKAEMKFRIMQALTLEGVGFEME